MNHRQFGPEIKHDELRHKCGVVGVWEPHGGVNVAQRVVAALHGIQNRGTDGAGVFVIDPAISASPFLGDKGEGMVSAALHEGGRSLDTARPMARIAVGHVRYGTNMAGGFDAAQPYHKDTLVLADNGHVEDMAGPLAAFGLDNFFESDSQAKTVLLSHVSEQTNAQTGRANGIIEAIHKVAPLLEGAFSWVIATKERLVGVRDPNGIRPLMLGYLQESGGFMLASEQLGLQRAGATFVRDLEPGEVMSISDAGIASTVMQREQSDYGGLCTLEYEYFARPIGAIDRRSVSAVRWAFGWYCAREHPVDADIIVGVPETGRHAAAGYAKASGLPLAPNAILRDSNSQRSFLLAGQTAREQAVHAKLLLDAEELEGQRIVIVDDSIVRGTTQKVLVQKVRDAGAREVHVRSASAQVRNPCFHGIDIGDADTLAARQFNSIEEFGDAIGADSLHYLSVAGMRAALASVELRPDTDDRLLQLALRPVRSRARTIGKGCMACMTGEYPTEIPAYVKVMPLQT